MNNPRRDKKLIKMWLTPVEIESLKLSLEEPNGYEQENIFEIISEAKGRGDLMI